MSKSQNTYPILDNLFGSKSRVKVLKFLFRNYPVNVSINDLARRVQEPQAVIRQEIKSMEKMGLIKKMKKQITKFEITGDDLGIVIT